MNKLQMRKLPYVQKEVATKDAAKYQRYKCESKKRFKTEELAKKAIMKNSKQVPYHCPICDRWHLKSIAFERVPRRKKR